MNRKMLELMATESQNSRVELKYAMQKVRCCRYVTEHFCNQEGGF